MTVERIQIAIGPLLFNWAVEKVTAFYEGIARCEAVDRVYLGEVVCAKREPLHTEALAEAGMRLADAGKQVVWSTLALPASPPERRTLRQQMERASGLLEINDASALFTKDPSQRFVAGPLLNIYNEDAARELVLLGCERLCGNVELPLAALAEIGRACPEIELELFAYGRLPLALSGRCYHARQHGRRKDTCQYVCDRDPDGMRVASFEGEEFLAVNGVQVMSHDVHLAAVEPAELRAAGIGALRLSPQTSDMAAVARAFRALCDGELDTAGLKEAASRAGSPAPFVDGYLYGKAGREWTPGI